MTITAEHRTRIIEALLKAKPEATVDEVLQQAERLVAFAGGEDVKATTGVQCGRCGLSLINGFEHECKPDGRAIHHKHDVFSKFASS